MSVEKDVCQEVLQPAVNVCIVMDEKLILTYSHS